MLKGGVSHYKVGLVFMMVGMIGVGFSSAYADGSDYAVQIRDHRFVPSRLSVPAGKKIKISIENLDPSAEEFESYDLHREKVVSGKGKIALFIGPLKAGEYKYFGEFNPKTAQGVIAAE